MDIRLKEVWGAVVLVCFYSISALSQNEEAKNASRRDTLRMPSAMVEVFRVPTPVERTPGAVVVLEATQLQNGVSPDIEDAVNAIPGVKMETRGIGGSRRIQMRSSGLRSPFAVRNVHMLNNGFVLTGAGGSSPLELLNPQWLHRLEILLGPTGAIFGGGYGGAIVASSIRPFSGTSSGLEIKLLNRIGTTGNASPNTLPLSFETGFSVLSVNAKSDWKFQATWSGNPGYRDQESNARQNIEIHRRWKPSPNVLNHIWTGWLQASWELPGSLTALQAENEPTNAPGKKYDARVDRERFWAGWSRTASNENSKNGFWAYAQTSQKDNPFGTSPFYQGMKEEQEINGSLRWWRGQTTAVNSSTNFTWDQSIIGRFENLQVEENDLVAPGELPRYLIESNTQDVWIGSGIRFEVADKWLFDMQGGAELIHRSTSGQFLQSEQATTDYEEIYTQLNWAPRIALGYTLDSHHSLSLQYAEGSSHPNTFELVDPESNAFANLNSEHAQTWEFSWKGSATGPNSFINWSLIAYKQTILDAIATIEGEGDGNYIANISGLEMNGLEGSFRTGVSFSSGASIEVSVHGNINQHAFSPNAQQLPGTPLHVAGGSLMYRNQAVTVRWNHLWNDRTALNDESSVWAPAYQRSDFRVDFSHNQNIWSIGVRNAFDAQYSNWLQINSFGGKHFNPAPGRTFWASWVCKFTQQ
jgi:iron complex outermembrane receptor protein